MYQMAFSTLRLVVEVSPEVRHISATKIFIHRSKINAVTCAHLLFQMVALHIPVNIVSSLLALKHMRQKVSGPHGVRGCGCGCGWVVGGGGGGGGVEWFLGFNFFSHKKGTASLRTNIYQSNITVAAHSQLAV